MSRGRPEKYPWAAWTDGRRHDITAGQDFDIPIPEMVNQLHKYARGHGLHAMTKFGPRVPDGVIRFVFVARLWWE